MLCSNKAGRQCTATPVDTILCGHNRAADGQQQHRQPHEGRCNRHPIQIVTKIVCYDNIVFFCFVQLNKMQNFVPKIKRERERDSNKPRNQSILSL